MADTQAKPDTRPKPRPGTGLISKVLAGVRQTWFDWRARAIFFAMIVSVLGTAVIYFLKLGLSPETHFGAVFASWVGGVALFVVVGAVAAIVSLVRPEEESFDARARILFRRQTGKHIDYIVSRIAGILEHYAESTALTVTLNSYHKDTQKFRVTVVQDTLVGSYLEDIPTEYRWTIEYKEVTSPPPGQESNRLVFVRIRDKAEGQGEDFATSIVREVGTTVEPRELCPVKSQLQFWVQAGTESNTQSPVRYTQKLRLIFENHLNTRVQIKLFSEDGKREDIVSLEPGDQKLGLELRELKPGIEFCDYRLLAP